eukprot:jgi/Hompol1/1520/HPOL_003444-RA
MLISTHKLEPEQEQEQEQEQEMAATLAQLHLNPEPPQFPRHRQLPPNQVTPEPISSTTPTNTVASRELDEQSARIVSVMTRFIGAKVIVSLNNGEKYRGICHTVDPDSKSVCLMQARIASARGRTPVLDQINFFGVDIESCSAIRVPNNPTHKKKENRAFKTDTAISGASGLSRERPLKKWTFGDDEAAVLPGLEDMGKKGRWDQFATNERLFGVTSDYEEHLYTTVVDKSAPDFKAKEAAAARLAAEIER